MSSVTQKKTATVIVLEPLRSDVDVESLAGFGETWLLFDSVLAACPSVFDTDTFTKRVVERLYERGYDPERDCFVVTGRQTKIAIALAAIAKEWHESPVRVLMYDGAAQTYVERRV